jgi:cytoskeletal protein RodZ
MYSKKIGVLAVVLIALVGGFLLLRPNSQENKKTATSEEQPIQSVSKEKRTQSAPRSNSSETVRKGRDSKNKKESAEAVAPTLVAGGEIKTITVKEGDEVNFTAQSPIADEIHVHGYDIARDVPAGGLVDVSFVATHAGIFEIEFHQTKKRKQVARLIVNP